MKRRIFVSALVFALMLALGAGAAPIQRPVDGADVGASSPAPAAWWQPAMDWLRTWLGAGHGPAPTEFGLEDSGESPIATTSQSTLDPDEPPTEAGPKISPNG